MMTVQKQWELFASLVVPKNAPVAQVREMRIAFYAGAQAVLGMMWDIGDNSISEDGGVAIIEGLVAETKQFATEVVGGRA